VGVFMNIDKTNIEFENFNPSHAIIDLANEIQDQVCDESPSDSFTKTILKRTENMFEGEMKIVSAAGTFLSHITGSDPVGVLAEMAHSVRDQIGHWRETRWSQLTKSFN
jgi:hypothetical protein